MICSPVSRPALSACRQGRLLRPRLSRLLIAPVLTLALGADAAAAPDHPLPSATRGIAREAPHALACAAPRAIRQQVADRPAGKEPVSPAIVHAVCAASEKAHADPFLLLAFAWQESRFDPTARSRFSSARGLLQFTTVTWLTVIRDFGAQYGLGRFAAAIRTDRDGRLWVTSRRVRKQMLRLRDDPELEAIMAAEALNHQKATLREEVGRKLAPADLYLLHLLGPAGAKDFLLRLARTPNALSIDVIGRAASPNTALWERDGRKLTLAQTYADLQDSLNSQVILHAGLFAPAG